MRWEDERYVRLYTRDTPEWVYLGWEAQCLFMQLLRKVDRAGVVDLGRSGYRGLASLVRMPEDVVEKALAVLLEDGCVEQSGTNLIIANFIEAQEACMSPAARQKESRERRRDMIRSGLDPDQRATVIYFIQSEHGGPVKIGRADDLAKRLQGLGTGRPDNLVVLGAFPGTVEDERRIHRALDAYREKGEWFSPSAIVLACARAATSDATVEQVLVHAEPRSGEESRIVTGHDSYTVTPSRAVPCRADHDFGSASAAPPPNNPEADMESWSSDGHATATQSRDGGPRTSRSGPEVPSATPHAMGPVKAKRGRPKKPETDCPNSEATGDEVKAWLSAWKIAGDEAEISHWLDHHRSKGNRFADWAAAWRTWQRNGVRFGRAPTQAPAPASPPKKPVDVAQVDLWMNNLRNAKAGEHIT